MMTATKDELLNEMQAYLNNLEVIEDKLRKNSKDQMLIGAYQHTKNLAGILKSAAEEKHLLDMYQPVKA
jgi:uncharacterized protein YktA (UPF0223 family)